VAISVITTFTTPYFVRLANPFSEWLNPRLPTKVKIFLDNYSSGGDLVKSEGDWRKLMKYYLSNIFIYSILSIAVILCFTYIIGPFITEELTGRIPDLFIFLIISLLTIVAMIPFLMGFISGSRKKNELAKKLMSNGHKTNKRRIAILTLFRIFLATFFVTFILFINFHTTAWQVIFISLSIIFFLFFAHKNFTAHWFMEDRFLSNLNVREEHERQKSPLRASINAQLSDRNIHLAKVTVSPDSPFIGKNLKELDIRHNYEVNIIKIIRGHKEIYFPTGNDFIYPSDLLTVIGTDEQINSFSKIMEIQETEESQTNKSDIKLKSFIVKEDSPILGKNLAQSGFRDFGCFILGAPHCAKNH
jgi:CPA2 family monovalent cation:H+ antiporter-2